MDIGEVSKRSGVAPSTLRYYEEIGLIVSSDRKGLRRQYSAKVLDVLALISLAKMADFRLEELGVLFTKSSGGVAISRAELKRKSLEIQRKIESLVAARNGLIHAAECKAPSHWECPKFRRLLVIATKRRAKKRKGHLGKR